MFKQNHVIINVWTSEDNKAIPGHNVGHVSLQTNEKYMSLWPGPRNKHIRSADLKSWQRSLLRANSYFEIRPGDFKVDYDADAVAEALSEDKVEEIKSFADLKAGQLAYIFDGSHLRRAEEHKPLQKDEILLAVTPLYATVRMALYGLNRDKIHERFEELKITLRVGV